MAATCDGLRVRTRCAVQFNRCVATDEGPRGLFVIPAGTEADIVDNEATRAYTKRAKAHGEDLIPLLLAGQVRYVDRARLELA